MVEPLDETQKADTSIFEQHVRSGFKEGIGVWIKEQRIQQHLIGQRYGLAVFFRSLIRVVPGRARTRLLPQ